MLATMCAFLKGPRKRRKEGIVYRCPDGTKPCKANQNLPNVIVTPAIGDHLEKGKKHHLERARECTQRAGLIGLSLSRFGSSRRTLNLQGREGPANDDEVMISIQVLSAFC